MEDLHLIKDLLLIKDTENIEYLGNKLLYDLCEEFPAHNNEQEIFAKIWLIGRSYAVALERGKGKKDEINDDFYKTIVSQIKNSGLDNSLDSLKGKSLISENIDDILDVYKSFHEITSEFGRGKKHSFCSKYLHFHFPNLFFIYDSRAAASISKLKIDISRFKDKKNKYKDLPYFNFFCQCFILQEWANESSHSSLTPRQIDIFLVEQSNKVNREMRKK
jgi:hypothetical protein